MANLAKLEELKTDLRSLLVSRNSQDITLPLLNELYKNISEKDIPYTYFNYTSLKQFLASMPEVLALRTNSKNELCAYHIETEKSKHISRLVALEKKDERRKNKKMPFKNNVIDPSILNQILYELCNSTIQNVQNKRIKKIDVLSRIHNELGEYAFYTANDLNKQLNELNHILYYTDDDIYFKAKVSENKLEAKANSKKKDTPVKNSSDQETIYDTLNNSVSGLIKQSTKERLQKLIKKYPKGIKCSELPKMYLDEYKLTLEYSDLGFNSIIEFVGALSDILKIVTPHNLGQHIVIDAEIPVDSYENCQKSNLTCKTQVLENLDKIEPLAKNLPQKIINSPISKTALYSESVNQVCIESILKDSGNELDITVSEVHNPSFFWVQLRKNKKTIDKLMENLQEFYMNQDLDMYRIPSKLVRPGLLVACIFDKQWHRGVVKSFKLEGPVIHFYDYGTNEIYNLKDLYFLDQQFSMISAQAIPCTLHNVKPVEADKWSPDVCGKFVERVFGKLFIASILSIDYERNSLLVSLADTSCYLNDTTINHWMVKNKMAEWGTPVVPKTIFTLKLCKEYFQKLSIDQPCNDSNSKKEISNDHKTGTTNSQITEKSSSTGTARISFNKKLEILRKYKAKILNNSLGSSSCDSSHGD